MSTVTVDLERFNPFDAAIQQNPHPYYHAMREQSPAWLVPGTQLRIITRMDLAQKIVRDTTTFSSKFGTPGEGPRPEIVEQLRAIMDTGWPRVATLLTADPPEQPAYRGTVNKSFNARAIAGLRPAIEAIVDSLIDGFIDTGHINLQPEFSTPVPVQVIAKALDLPSERGADIKRWSDDSVANIGSDITDERRIEATKSIVEFQHFLNDQFDERRTQAREDILSKLVNAEMPSVDGNGTRPLETPELLSILQQLLVAGNETTTKLFNEMVMLLGRHKDQWQRIKDDRSRIPLVVEEALRLSTPTQGMFRVVTRDTDVDGVAVPAGSRILVMFAAANRDPAVFDDPDHFDPGRPNVRDHLAFGLGIHFCVGAPLSRLEAAIALEKLTERWDDFELTAENTFEYEPSFMLRGLKDLYVDFTPVAMSSIKP